MNTPSLSHIDQVRAQMQAVTNRVYLNTGSVGPMADVTFETLHSAAAHEFEFGRASMSNSLHIKAQLPILRQQMASVLGASAETIALTHHTTDGMNVIIHGFPWQPGDEILINNWEHQGGYLPTFTAARQHNLTVRTAHFDWHDSAEQMTRKITAAMTAKTRLIVISHIMWNTGMRVDLAAIVAAAHAKGVYVLVDGAQSVGSMPLDLPASGVDFYAGPAQKWLCGPEGLGVLYVRPDRLSMIQPLYTGYLSLAATDSFDYSGNWLPKPDTSRFEVGSVYRPAVYAMQANLDWLENSVGWAWVYERIVSLTRYAWNRLDSMNGVNMITHRNAGSGLITFDLTGYDPARVTLALQEQHIVVRYLMLPYALRIAVGFYNNEADIDTLVEALGALTTRDPESLPVLPN